MKTTGLKYAVRLMCVILALALMATFTFAQSSTTGAIAGTVQDANGAAVPNAKITVTSTATNAVTESTSGGLGEYRVADLTPGSYYVAVSAANFGAYKANVSVEVGRISTVDPKLKVGGGKGEVVEVTDVVQQVNTQSQEQASNFGQEQISELPINGRRWTNYALLTPGSNPDGTFGLVSFRGISGLLNNFTVDGGDNNNNFYAEERGRTRLTYSTSQDSIQEFQINTSNYSSEYGRAAGGAVNAVTKSGTNKLHGSGYWYDRNNAIGATNPSTKLFGQPYKPTDVRYTYGATVGGPVIKDKVFFFFNWDEFHRNFPGLSIPSTAATSGFGCTSSGTCPTITVSAPVTPCPASNTSASNFTSGTTYSLGEAFYCRFNGNMALAQQAASDVNSFIADPTKGLLGVTPRRGDQRLFLPKLDVRLFGGNLATSFNWLSWNSPSGIQTQPSNILARDEFGNDIVQVKSLNMNYDKAINATTAMSMKYHWSKEHLSGSWQTPLPGQPSVAGVTGSHPPGVSVSNWLPFGTQSYLPRDQNPDETQNQGSMNLTKTVGRHTLKGGLEIINNGEIVSSLNEAYGTYRYTGNYSILNFVSDAYNSTTRAFTGSNARSCFNATVAGGVPCYNSNFTQGVGTLNYGFSTRDYAFYFQDDWKASKRLTLNLGVRYEYEQKPAPQFANPAVAATGVFPSDKNNFGPRLGFSYDALGNGKLAIRGGYGLYFARIINSTISAALTGTGVATAQPSYSLSASTLVGATPLLYPNILSSAAGLTLLPPNVVFFDPSLSNPYIHQGDLIVEYEVAPNTVASVSYLISKGRKLQSFLDTNLPTTYNGNVTYTLSDTGAQVVVPSYGTAPRPNTAFNQITDIGNQVYSDYYAIVAQLNKRMSHGLLFQGNYTYSRAKDNGQGSFTFSTSNNAFDPNNIGQEYGLSNFDFTNKFTFNAVWQPEYFKGRKDAAHYILDGWTVAPVIYASSGAPYTGGINGSLPSSSTIIYPSTTNVCLSAHSGGLACASGNNRVPSIPRNSFRTPFRWTTDLRIGRNIAIKEKYTFELLAESFNLFNHSNVLFVNSTQYSLGTCTGSWTSATAGSFACPLTASTTFGTPSSINTGTTLAQRQIQFSIRFKF